MRVTLTVIEGPHRGSSFAFEQHDAFVVGRSPVAQFRLPLKDKTLSRVHFLVEVNPPSCRLLDMASTNGVHVNGRRVHAVDLADGDQIRAGETLLAFAVEGAEAGDDPLARETLQVFAIEGADPERSILTRIPSEAETEDRPEFPAFPGYRVERPLGEGGMGVVYLARRESDGTLVALKAIRPAFLAAEAVLSRFVREASILRKLDHPHIVRFHDIGFAAGRLYFAMAYVEGTSLDAALKARGRLPIRAAVGLTRQVLKALGFAHALGFIHRDIKPANLLTHTEGGKSRAMLADFGLAKLYQESSLSGMSLTGQMGGTLSYMPPEQITHFRDARPPADLYSLGATLYTLLTGRKVFESSNRPEVQVARILFEQPAPVQSHRPEIPDGLAEVIHRSLLKPPDDRWPDAESMRAALAPFAKPG